MSVRLDVAKTRAFLGEVFVGAGLDRESAGLVTDSLVDTSLRGVDSHGIMRVPLYVEALRSGKVPASPAMELTEMRPGIAAMDAKGGMGHVAMAKAMDEAIARASTVGVASVAVRNSSHFGASGHYALMAARADCIGFVWTNGPAVMPPVGGKEARVSNNPLAFAVPRGADWPLLLDISFSVVARGKVRKAIVDGATTIPEHWMLTADGKQTTDPAEALEGLGRPIASHKGFGMALMGEVMGGILTGSGFGLSVGSQWGKLDLGQASTIAGSSPHPGHICTVWSVEALMPVATFLGLVDRLVDEVHSCPTVDGAGRVLVPGELEYLAELDRTGNGIPVSDIEYGTLVDVAGAVGVEIPGGMIVNTDKTEVEVE